MKKQIKETARRQIGAYLKGIREDQGISTYAMDQMGVRHEALKAIESGAKNYSIDNFLKYIQAIDVYFFLRPKEGKHLDFDHMIDQMQEE